MGVLIFIPFYTLFMYTFAPPKKFAKSNPEDTK